MNRKQQRARELQRLIAEVLRRNWDPIGLRNVPASEDEYDAYVGGVYRLLVSGAGAHELAEHLAHVEAQALGFADTDPRMLIPVAKKLLKLNAQFESHWGCSPPGPARAKRIRERDPDQRRSRKRT